MDCMPFPTPATSQQYKDYISNKIEHDRNNYLSTQIVPSSYVSTSSSGGYSSYGALTSLGAVGSVLVVPPPKLCFPLGYFDQYRTVLDDFNKVVEHAATGTVALSAAASINQSNYVQSPVFFYNSSAYPHYHYHYHCVVNHYSYVQQPSSSTGYANDSNGVTGNGNTENSSPTQLVQSVNDVHKIMKNLNQKASGTGIQGFQFQVDPNNTEIVTCKIEGFEYIKNRQKKQNIQALLTTTIYQLKVWDKRQFNRITATGSKDGMQVELTATTQREHYDEQRYVTKNKTITTIEFSTKQVLSLADHHVSGNAP